MPCNCIHQHTQCFGVQTLLQRPTRQAATRFRREATSGRVFCAENKGFSPREKARPKTQQQKVSKRGTLASRPDPSQVSSQKQQQQADQQLPDEPSRQQGSEEVPEVVNDRMLKRIIAFSGIPVFVGFSLFPFFYFLKVTQHVDLPMSVVYIVQLLTFGGGFFGITYGILSASWDPLREGSTLGFTEFKANLPLILDRIKSRGGKGRV
ncbi:hypothetical protein ABBQ32_004374 [Trebouxia sp. C0010 RCD-2024]